MTPAQFRALALALEGAVEVGHMGHPDFRVKKRIFATMGYPDDGHAVVKLTPEQQRDFVRFEPEVFTPVKGGWGAKGMTQLRLAKATAKTARPALEAAWRNCR